VWWVVVRRIQVVRRHPSYHPGVHAEPGS